MSWPTVNLAEVASIERKGIAPSAIASGTDYLGLEHIESGGVILGKETVANGDLASTKFIFSPDHVLYGKLRPYLAKIALPDFEGVCSTDILPIKPGPRLDKRFLAYYLRQPSMVDYANSRSTGANLPRLSPKGLAEFPIPLPPLKEQQRIAGMLDQADALRHLRAQALDKLNTLGQSIFHEMFGAFHDDYSAWPTRRLETLIDDAQIGAVRGAKEMDDEKPVEYLRMDSIGMDGSLSFANLKRVDASTSDLSKYGLRVGDFLFNTRNSRELVGKTAVVRQPFDGIYNNNILRLRLHGDMTADFLDAFLRTRKGQDILGAIKSGTTSVFAIYQKSLMAIDVPVPPRELQQKFSERMRALFFSRQQYSCAVAQTSNLFASLQHRAFRGEL